MASVTATIPRPAERCWRTFVETSLLCAWVPGLRRARLVRKNDDGLPLEVSFEFGQKLSYSLVYGYDEAAHVVRWSPRAGKRDAVSGSVRFDDAPEGCRMTYELDAGATTERSSAHAGEVVAAFVAFMQRSR